MPLFCVVALWLPLNMLVTQHVCSLNIVQMEFYQELREVALWCYHGSGAGGPQPGGPSDEAACTMMVSDIDHWFSQTVEHAEAKGE